MKKNTNQTTAIKYKKSRRGYNARQIIKGVTLGGTLVGFGAAQRGVFNNVDFTKINVGDFFTNILNQAASYYQSIVAKLDPKGQLPSWVFVGAAGLLVGTMIWGRIKKRKLETNTINAASENICNLTNENITLNGQVQQLTDERDALQAQLSKKRTRTTTTSSTTA